MNWRWISKAALVLLHGESLAEHGGGAGMRDEGLLDPALARPRNASAYGSPDAAELAAAYGFVLARNHPFVDGNKRAAFLSVGLFLHLNGLRLRASQAEATLAMIALSSGEMPETEFARWLRDRIGRR